MAKNDQQKAPRSFSHFLANFHCTFSLGSRTFWLNVFWPSVFAVFRTIRLLAFSGCRLVSPCFSLTA